MNCPLIRNQGKASRRFAVLLLSALPIHALSQSIAVPNKYLQAEGNSSLSYPFWSGFTVRYQQVYDASQFSLATNGAWIYDLNFRPDGGTPAFGAPVSDVEIHLSTTLRSPDSLSPIFSENIGSDDMQVFSGSVILGSSGPSSPQPWYLGANEVRLTNYFWYNPTAGDLLLDVRIHTAVSDIIPAMDAATNQGVSCVYAPSVEATNGTTDTRGLVTLITIAPVPSLAAFISNFGTATNFVAIRWPAQPTTFVLQQSTSFGSNAVWQDLPGVGGSNLVFKEHRIPITPEDPSAFFRLAGPAP